jgi:hypothetical protein
MPFLICCDSQIQAFWPGELLQIPALGAVKLSFVFFYRRIFTKNAAPKFNIATWFMIGLIIAWTLSFFFAITFICGTDFSAYWTSTTVEKANCVDTDALHNAFAVSDVITDLLIITLPIPMVCESLFRISNFRTKSHIFFRSGGCTLQPAAGLAFWQFSP